MNTYSLRFADHFSLLKISYIPILRSSDANEKKAVEGLVREQPMADGGCDLPH